MGRRAVWRSRTLAAASTAVLLVACQPTASTGPSDGASPAESPAGPAVGDCAPKATGGDPWRLAESTADLSDFSGGSIGLCIQGQAPVTLRSDAACLWSADRRSLLRLDAQVSEGPLDGSLLSLTMGEGAEGLFLIGSGLEEPAPAYRSKELPTVRMSGTEGRIDPIRLDYHGRAEPPLGPTLVVQLGFRCEAPPPAKPGLAGGQAVLSVDGVVGRPWPMPVECRWSLVAGRPEVTSLGTSGDGILLGDRRITFSLERGPQTPDDLALIIRVSTATDSEEYGTARVVARLRAAEDSSSGLVRFVGSTAFDPHGFTLDGTPATTSIDGTVGWQCGAPPRVVEPWLGFEPDRDGPWQRIPATLELGAPLFAQVEGTVRCPMGGEEPRLIDPLDASFQVGEESLRLIWTGTLIVVRTRGDQALGEYESQASWPPYSPGEPIRETFGWIIFRPTDPAFEPFLGQGGPTKLTGAISFTCP